MNKIWIAAAVICLASGAAQAGTVTVGVDNSSNCVPFGCAASNNLVTFQQIYAGSQFSGPTSIGSVSFLKDSTSPANALLETMSFNLSFYAATTTVAGLSSNPSANRGALLADFGTFSISGAQPDALTFASSSAFTYNPLASNLLMQITVLSDTGPGTAVFQSDIRTPNQGAVTRRLIVTDFDFNFTGTNGLVTTFSSDVAAAVPEPATWSMMIGGLGVVGGSLRRKRKAAKSVSFA